LGGVQDFLGFGGFGGDGFVLGFLRLLGGFDGLLRLLLLELFQALLFVLAELGSSLRGLDRLLLSGLSLCGNRLSSHWFLLLLRFLSLHIESL
jgi:hypothetical protein